MKEYKLKKNKMNYKLNKKIILNNLYKKTKKIIY